MLLKYFFENISEISEKLSVLMKLFLSFEIFSENSAFCQIFNYLKIN